MPRWIWFIIAVGVGIAAGLYYGWVLSPVAYVDTTPDTLSADYRTDYVLMAAEDFHASQDPSAAARQLAILGSQPPAAIVQAALDYGRSHAYPAQDISLLQDLAFAMQTWQQPTPGHRAMKSGWALVGMIVGGLVLGLGMGLLYSWVIRPVTYVDTAPVALRADFKDQFRAMIAAAYAANANLPRAQVRLALLGDPSSAGALIEQARRAGGPGGSPGSALALANLAVALSGPPGTASPVPSPTETLTATDTPAPTQTARPRGTPSKTARARITPTATRTPRPTLTQRPTLTPHPSATPTVTPGQPFQVVSNEDVCDADLPPGLLQVVVQDADRKPVPGAEIIISWQGGQESFFTGLKPELGDGYADYAMQEGVTYSLRLALDSETADGLSIPACESSDGSPFDGGISLVFRQP